MHCRSILSFDLIGIFGETFLYFYYLTTIFLENTVFGKPGNIHHSLGCQFHLVAIQKFQNGFT